MKLFVFSKLQETLVILIVLLYEHI